MCGEVRERSFHHRGGPGKLVEARLCGRKDQGSSFHYGGGPAKLVEACLSRRKGRKNRFHHGRGSMELVQAGLCVGRSAKVVFTTVVDLGSSWRPFLGGRKDRESIFTTMGVQWS